MSPLGDHHICITQFHHGFQTYYHVEQLELSMKLPEVNLNQTQIRRIRRIMGWQLHLDLSRIGQFQWVG